MKGSCGGSSGGGFIAVPDRTSLLGRVDGERRLLAWTEVSPH